MVLNVNVSSLASGGPRSRGAAKDTYVRPFARMKVVGQPIMWWRLYASQDLDG
jgi:hypothetical protein